MMKAALCTISTHSHLFKVEALRQSVHRFMPDLDFVVLLSDQGQLTSINTDKTQVLHLDRLSLDLTGQGIRKKYDGPEQADRLRWCMKPVLLQYLLETQDYDLLIYVDNDIFFYSDPRFLYEELAGCGLLLSPHWRDMDPRKDAPNFEASFRDGMFNGGFVGATKVGIPALNWWARACLYACEKNYQRGLYDDQRYLDSLPVHFETAKVLRHRGCNVAVWNRNENRRSRGDAGQVRINGQWPLVFIHLTKDLFREIYEFDRDLELRPEVEQYLKTLWRLHPAYRIKGIRLPYPEEHPLYKEPLSEKARRKMQKKGLEYRLAAKWYGRKLRHFFRTGKLNLPD